MARRHEVQTYIRSRNDLFRFFKCEDDYPPRMLTDFQWTVIHENDVSFFAYWKDGEGRKTAVIARKNGQPILYRTKDYTMVIAIDCIKTAFVVKNTEEKI